MEERQVTVGAQTHKLPPLFMVMATQNPIEQEGTYPLPEAQLDRFLMHVQVGYTDEKSEGEIMRLVRSEESGTNENSPVAQKLSQQAVLDARDEISSITVSEAVDNYIVALVFATRYPDKLDADLAKWIQIGVSPRGAIGLDKVSRAHAWLNGRDFVTPDDVKSVVHDVFRHRLSLSYEAHAAGTTADQAIDRIVERVAVA
jgi:MoxR-like ATPase